ncbi:hypothetical protein RSAG8_07320, partial [Rhizoctonia solani AG-8 WAC10335]
MRLKKCKVDGKRALGGTRILEGNILGFFSRVITQPELGKLFDLE